MLETNNTYIAAEPTAKPMTTPSPIPTPEPTPKPTPVPVGEQAVSIAMQYLGTPYLWGGTTPDGFDCSGLVYYVYACLGICVPRTAEAQSTKGYNVTRDELKAGDLVFFANGHGVHHVGIYVSDGRFIHAPMTGDVVKLTPLSARGDYYCARRIAE